MWNAPHEGLGPYSDKTTIRPESFRQSATGLNGSSLKNLAGALPTDGVGCTLSVGREVKMEIPVNRVMTQ